MGIACSKFSQAQRTSLIHIALGVDDVGQFVPGLWNRRAKARGALRELEKAGHIVRDGRRLLLIESSFAHISEPPSTKQLLFPEEPLLGTALAEVSRLPGDAEKLCPVPDRTLCPSSDGRSVLSRTGRELSQSTAMSYALSDPGPPHDHVHDSCTSGKTLHDHDHEVRALVLRHDVGELSKATTHEILNVIRASAPGLKPEWLEAWTKRIEIEKHAALVMAIAREASRRRREGLRTFNPAGWMNRCYLNAIKSKPSARAQKSAHSKESF